MASRPWPQAGQAPVVANGSRPSGLLGQPRAGPRPRRPVLPPPCSVPPRQAPPSQRQDSPRASGNGKRSPLCGCVPLCFPNTHNNDKSMHAESAWLHCDPLIVMRQPTDFWDHYQPATARSLERARLGTIHRQCLAGGFGARISESVDDPRADMASQGGTSSRRGLMTGRDWQREDWRRKLAYLSFAKPPYEPSARRGATAGGYPCTARPAPCRAADGHMDAGVTVRCRPWGAWPGGAGPRRSAGAGPWLPSGAAHAWPRPAR